MLESVFSPEETLLKLKVSDECNVNRVYALEIYDSPTGLWAVVKNGEQDKAHIKIDCIDNQISVKAWTKSSNAPDHDVLIVEHFG